MNRSRRIELNLSESELTHEEKSNGFHHCPEWGYDVIGPGDKESEFCFCNMKGKNNKISRFVER